MSKDAELGRVYCVVIVGVICGVSVRVGVTSGSAVNVTSGGVGVT